MRISSSLAIVLGLVFGMTEAANAGDLWHSFSLRKQTCESCPQYPSVSHSVGCHVSLSVACLDSTCDMYQHYAYYPECHGSYYFRPYNWEHYYQDMSEMLGVGHMAPYSVDGMAELKPVSIPEQPVIKVRHQKLPNIEDLLRGPMVLPSSPQPVGLPFPTQPEVSSYRPRSEVSSYRPRPEVSSYRPRPAQ